VAALAALAFCAWLTAAACALVAFIALERVSHFRVYWHWVIQVSDSGIAQIGALATPGYRASLEWHAVSKWQREKLTGPGRPKVRGKHVYKYLLTDGTSTIAWQSNYFPKNDALVALLTPKLGEPEDIES
jgi:hypothetical protein